MSNPLKIYLRYKGHYIGVDPKKPNAVYAIVINGDQVSAVNVNNFAEVWSTYTNPNWKPNGYEAITLGKLPTSRYTSQFDDAKTFLTIDDVGNIRASQQAESWESHCVISPPTEYSDTPAQLYQPDHGVILEVEQQL